MKPREKNGLASSERSKSEKGTHDVLEKGKIMKTEDQWLQGREGREGRIGSIGRILGAGQLIYCM
jgi:hypothetical protein